MGAVVAVALVDLFSARISLIGRLRLFLGLGAVCWGAIFSLTVTEGVFGALSLMRSLSEIVGLLNALGAGCVLLAEGNSISVMVEGALGLVAAVNVAAGRVAGAVVADVAVAICCPF